MKSKQNLSIEEIKEFILWCRSQNIYKAKINDIEVEFTALSMYADSLQSTEAALASLTEKAQNLPELEKNQNIADDPDLFYSVIA